MELLRLDLRPMLAKETDKVPPRGKWVIEPKLDGWRFIFHSTNDGVRSFAGRNGSEYTGKTQLVERQLGALAPGTVVDGELIASEPGVAVSTALASRLPMEFVMFDVLYVGGTDVRDMPYHDRRQILETAHMVVDEAVGITPQLPANQGVYEKLVLAGAEGVVCKRSDSIYVPKRSGMWLKIKAESTVDGIVTGFGEGEGGWVGTFGAFRVRLDNGQVTTIRMKDDEMRLGVTADPGAFLGRCVEIKHNGLGKEGKPRHPRFLRWRDDKTAKGAA